MSHSRRHALLFQWAAISAAAIAAGATLDVMRRSKATQHVEVSALLRSGPPQNIVLGGRALDNAFSTLFVRPDAVARISPATSSLASRYRLVGTLANAEAPDRATAFIETKVTGRQRRYRIGEALEPDSIVQSILPGEVWVTTPAGVVRLVREGKSMNQEDIPDDKHAATPSGSGSDPGRFGGVQTGENNWTFKREAIMNYYQELLDSPERLVKVFDSLAPIYDDQRKIEGYRVQIEGERAFFNAVGLRQGDVVRKVNEIDMTNRYRAENLIRRYAQNDLDLVVIELERDGHVVKQVYHTQ